MEGDRRKLLERKTKKEVGDMRRMLVFVSALMLSVMVSICGASSGVDKLTRDRDMLSSRLAEVKAKVGSLANEVGKVRFGRQREQLMKRLILLETEAILLSEALREVDKIVFGIDVLASVVASGGYLDETNYQASAVIFDKVVEDANSVLRKIVVDCSFCSVETRKVAAQTLEDLREWR